MTSDTLDGDVALVTGASSGIGAATARSLADEGAAVALAARREERLEELAEEIESAGGEALVVPTDATDESQVRGMVEETVEQLGGLDVLVNNAGVMLLEPIADADPDNWQQMLDLNVQGLMVASQAALGHMQEKGAGDIVNLSSVAGRKAYAGSGGYNASKFGVTAFSEALRQEVVDSDIRVTTIEPGAVDTELAEHIPDEDQKEQIEGMMDEMEPLRPEDIARSIRFAVTQPSHVDINELLIRPTRQEL
ncbi:SDR family NAD(P)-dependent oxidoreductase [Halalkalicoccus jeotgali]|uniref:Dehydrogenase n=1 Tax=Halalkalicoccus jeotgali (strain DSM 18796 / CECT 7217 / JCM 14584 / KCTC 4019 / B3) TaxID=795797 RepID=D8J385_HALJB|nr:SDR family NAD(P)-dependent oxidoreductase [Halalkalicoccus jeotgali]ADJ15192.1 dehydrogenase [Halalkalicoccus jeotgali B3]ELY35231.1 dehydrogenase [Halalkalicoccus jeotgali B3]